MSALVKQALSAGTRGAIRPLGVVQKLKAWGKHFKRGRQEDAHEFLRYFVDAMQVRILWDNL